jgi:hypothetical protein
MTSSCQLEVKMKAKVFLRPENGIARSSYETDRLFVFIRHDIAEIWRLRYGLTIRIGTLKNMASTGVFVRVLIALERSNRCAPQTTCMIST